MSLIGGALTSSGFWAAIAAGISAWAATKLNQDSSRPLLLITKWTRSQRFAEDALRFQTNMLESEKTLVSEYFYIHAISNIGQGHAKNIEITDSDPFDPLFLKKSSEICHMDAARISYVPSKSEKPLEIEIEIEIKWNKIPENVVRVDMNINIGYHDINNRYYETRYLLSVGKSKAFSYVGVEDFGQGIGCLYCKTDDVPIWKSKFTRWKSDLAFRRYLLHNYDIPPIPIRNQWFREVRKIINLIWIVEGKPRVSRWTKALQSYLRWWRDQVDNASTEVLESAPLEPVSSAEEISRNST